MKHINKNRLMIMLCVLLIIGLISYCYLALQQEQQQELAGRLTLYGNVEVREVNLSFRIPGLLKKMLFEEGATVKKGVLIACLDQEQYIDQLQEAQALVQLNNAQLEKLLAGTRFEELAQAQAQVAEQEAILVSANNLAVRAEKGYQAGVVSKQEYEEARQQQLAANARLLLAKNGLLKAINGPMPQDIRVARANLQAVQAKAAHFEKIISYTLLTAPTDGVILTRIKEPGSFIAASEPVYTLALNSPKWIQAYIDETQLGKIKTGMPVQISNDSYPKKIYLGNVGFISPTAEFTPKAVETAELRTSLVYRIRIVAQDPANQLRQGMPVTLTIEI